jgi:hypothetical protein
MKSLDNSRWDCNKVFTELNEAIDGKLSGSKLITGIKQRMKFIFLERQISLLHSNREGLERLECRSSLPASKIM